MYNSQFPILNLIDFALQNYTKKWYMQGFGQKNENGEWKICVCQNKLCYFGWDTNGRWLCRCTSEYDAYAECTDLCFRQKLQVPQ